MSPVGSERIRTSGVCLDTGAAQCSPTTTRTMRESIGIEGSEESRSQILDHASASSGCVTAAAAATTTARDSSSPPLTLIDANVARQASGSLSDKSHRRESQTLSEQQKQHQARQQPPVSSTTTVPGAGRIAIESNPADKLAGPDKDKFLKQQQDELNNNSIHAQSYCSDAQKQQLHPIQSSHRQQIQPAKSLLTQPIKVSQSSQQSQPISPLNLLTGLRMHTNNLRSQQQQLGAKNSNTTTSSPNSFVESSLNPRQEDDEDSLTTSRASSKSQPPKPLSSINVIPSYTSIFDKPRASQLTASTSSTPPGNQSQQQQLPNTHQRKDQATTLRTTSRSPLRKQAAQFDSLNSSRTLLTTISSINNKSSRQEQGGSKKLPAVFDYSSDQLRRPIDYDNQSRSPINYDLEAASSVERSQTDDEEDDGVVDDDDDCDELATADEKSPFKKDNLQLTTATNRFRPHAPSERRQQEPASTNKFAGSAARLNQFMRPRNSSVKGRMSSSQCKKSLAAQTPQAHQTRISLSDVSRPPSFDTTTNLHKHDQTKAASCRKLDLLEQVAHLECYCYICSKNRKLSNLQDNLYHSQSTSGLHAKLSKFDANSAKSIQKAYPKTRFCHLVLKSIILILCTLLLLLLLVGAIVLSHYLPQSMDKVMNASRSFNVTIAGK